MKQLLPDDSAVKLVKTLSHIEVCVRSKQAASPSLNVNTLAACRRLRISRRMERAHEPGPGTQTQSTYLSLCHSER